MSRARPGRIGRPALFTVFGLLCILLPLTPYAGSGPQATADLFFAFAVAWTLRDPLSAPAWLVIPLALLADLLLSRPLGLGALGLVLAVETVRAHSGFFRDGRFIVQWLAFAAGFALVQAFQLLLLRVTVAAAPTPEDVMWVCIATAAVFPAVLLFVAKGLRIGRQPAGPPGESMVWGR